MPTFYRIVQIDPPTEADFLSYEAQGRPLYRDTLERQRSWAAVSAFNTIDSARVTALTYPRIGSFIAVLEIAADGPVTYEQSGRDAAHYELIGEAPAMLAAVVRVVRV